MKSLLTLVFAAFLPFGALAQGGALAADGGSDAPEAAAVAPDEAPAEGGAVAEEAAGVADEGLPVLLATEVELDDFLWVKRPLLVFADTPADPAFERQVRYILERADEFHLRDVVLITDTDPAARSQARQRLRPRGFMLAILDKDGEVKQRRPAPRTAREIIAVIDRFPLRRQEMLEERPSGRD